MAEELSDEQVFGTQPKGNELSDEDVFGASPTQEQPSGPFAFRQMSESEKLAAHVGRAGDIMAAFGHAFGEEYNEPLGLASGPVKEGLVKYGVLPGKASDYTDPRKPFMAFNEAVMLPLAAGLDAMWRAATSAAPRGVQAAGSEAGIPRDIVAMPEAFLGSPHPLGVPRLTPPLPSVKPEPIEPPRVKVEGVVQPIDTSVARSVAAKTGIPEVDAVLTSPTTQMVIDNAIVDRQYDVPYMAGGSVPMEDPTIYVDRHVPRQQTAPRASGPGAVTFNPADAWIVHENVEQHVMELLTKNGMSDQEAYRVAHFEYAEKAEQAWYRAHDIDQVAAEKEQMSWLPRIQHENPENPPPNLYEKPYPHDSVAGARREAVTEAPPTPQEIARAREIIADNQEQIASPGQIVYHGSGARFTQFSSEFNLTGEGSNVIARGHYVAENINVAEEYKITGEGLLQEEATAKDWLASHATRAEAASALRQAAEEKITARPGSPERLQAETRMRAAQLIEKGWKPPEGILYQAMLLQPKEAFLDWDKPLSEQSPQVREALKNMPNISNARSANPLGSEIHELADLAFTDKYGSQVLNDIGIPGIRFLDQFSRGTRDLIDLKRSVDYWEKELEGARNEGERKQLELSLGQAKKALQDEEANPKTSNYVIFNDNDLAITHINGEPLLQVAKDLGIIGEPRPNIAEGKPADAAAASMGGGAGKKPPPPPGGGPPQPPQPPSQPPPQPGANPWRDRFEHFVGKLETPEDVKQLIRNAADEQGEFPAARQGDIKLNHVDDLAQAAGVQPGEIDRRGLGRELKNDGEVRIAMQMMLQLADNMKTAAREVKADASPENLIKLQEAIMRRDLGVEQVVGLRAEWGRTGNVFQEFLRDVKDQESLSKFLKDTKGRTPDDLKRIADAVNGLDKTSAARFMNDMRDPTAWDKFMWYYVNALISGYVTHGKYIIANAAFAAYETALVTPVAGAIGTVRRALTGDAEGVYVGEAGARMWGLVAGTPDAVVAGAKAAWSGLQTPLPGEVAQNIAPKTKTIFGQKTVSTPLLNVLTAYGAPSRMAAGIHSFFNFLGYRASIEAQAYREIAKGLPPTITQAQRPPVAPDSIRFFHGGDNPTSGGGRWVNESETYARNYRPGQSIHYVDIPQSWLDQQFPDTDIYSPKVAGSSRQPYPSFEAPEQFAKQMKPADRAVQSTRLNDSFWQRRQNLVDNPTKEMMNTAIEEGARLTFINELSPAARKMSTALRATKAGQVILPFTHIPFNILERGIEGTPAAFLPAETRNSLFGKNGAVKQDMAIARIVVGSAVAAWGANHVINDMMTGYGPTDPEERARWLATGHQPYSIKIGNEWISYQRFGPIGTMLGLQSNLAEVIPHLTSDQEGELTKALTMTVHATGRLMEDEVGMQTLAGLILAIQDPEHQGVRWLANFAGGFLPLSSAMRQTASSMDPEMREAKTVVDGLRYYIPGMRQQLLPMRDWLGAPISNAGYGGDLPIPGLSSFIQHRDATVSAIADEMQRLELRPAPPQNKIGSVQLPPQMYDEYKAIAGSLKRASLERWVNQPGWYNLPDFVRKTAFQNSIRTANETAGTYMKMQHPEIIVKNVENEVNRIQGVKPTKLKD